MIAALPASRCSRPDDTLAGTAVGTLELVLELTALKAWTPVRWRFAAVMMVVSALAIGLPTDVIPNPIFGRQGTPVEPWAVPVLIATSVLSGLLFATYLRDREPSADGNDVAHDDALDRPGRIGGFGGLLAFFAVGCPICNKVVVIALGTSGALSWFAPMQPYLGLIALGLVAWALRVRLRGMVACSADAGQPEVDAAPSRARAPVDSLIDTTDDAFPKP